MQLTARQRRSLEAICRTFVPDDEALAAVAADAPAALLDAVDLNPRADVRTQLGRLLSLWDSPLTTALGGGGFRAFSALPRERREQVLLSWCDSRVPQRRAAFQALRKGALSVAYLRGGPDGGRNPAWDAMGYPGPRGAPRDAPPKAIDPLPVARDTTLDCDVCVVGSGAGGGVAAAVLAAAGLDVVVLEAGGYYDDGDFDGAEYEAYRRMYVESAAAATHDQSVGLLAGTCLGGGTVINYTTSFRTPDEVREEWAGHGVSAFTSDTYTASLDAVWERLGVREEPSRPSGREQMLKRGLDALGWHSGFMPRNVDGCDEGEVCGYCGFGCPLGAKRSTVKTWLHDGHAAGARILVRTRAERIVTDGGAASGVEARTTEGHRVVVRARAVVVACGTLETPALLRRSGLGNEVVGKNLHLHPVVVVVGVFDEEIRPWEGTMQAVYSDEHRHLDGGYGLKYETAAVHPGLLVAFTPWRGADGHFELLRALPRAVGVGALLRDRDGGEVRVGRDGHPVARYRLSDYDLGHMRVGLDGAAQILEAAGARRIFSSHVKWVGYEPGRDGGRERFRRDADACGWSAGRVVLFSFHIMGTARMGGSPSGSACGPEGELWGTRGVVVADASTFPTASGVNPMISIEAIAHMNASALASRLT